LYLFKLLLLTDIGTQNSLLLWWFLAKTTAPFQAAHERVDTNLENVHTNLSAHLKPDTYSIHKPTFYEVNFYHTV